MLKRIFSLFNSNEPNESQTTLTIEMACTVLLYEVIFADGLLSERETLLLNSILKQQFSLSEAEVKELINQAKYLSEHATDFHQFTSKINQTYSPQEKTKIIALLWQLAMSDGELSSIENHMIRKIAGLLHLSQSEYMQAKNTILKP